MLAIHVRVHVIPICYSLRDLALGDDGAIAVLEAVKVLPNLQDLM